MTTNSNSEPTPLHLYLEYELIDGLGGSAQDFSSNHKNILQIMSPTHMHVTNVLTLAWDALARRLISPVDSKEKANLRSSIINKLSCAETQIQAIEAAISQPLLDRANYASDIFAPLPPYVLEVFQAVKKQASKFLHLTQPTYKSKEVSIAFTWEDLSNSLKKLLEDSTDSPPLLQDIDDIATNIHKLTPSYCQLKMLEVHAYQNIFKKPLPTKEAATPLHSSNNNKSKSQKSKNASPSSPIASNSQSPLPTPNPEFIKLIRQNKQVLSQITEIMHPRHSIAEKVIDSAWDSLQDLMISAPPTSPKELNLYSSIIHKLTTSSSQIKSIEIKHFDRFLKAYLPKPNQQKVKEHSYTLTPEQRKHFEETVEKTFGAIVR